MRDFRQSQTGALHMIYTLPRMLLALSLVFLLAYFFYRGFLWGLKLYRLNNSAYKKIKKGETFKEWFFIQQVSGCHTKTAVGVLLFLFGASCCCISDLHYSPFLCGRLGTVYC